MSQEETSLSLIDLLSEFNNLMKHSNLYLHICVHIYIYTNKYMWPLKWDSILQLIDIKTKIMCITYIFLHVSNAYNNYLNLSCRQGEGSAGRAFACM